MQTFHLSNLVACILGVLILNVQVSEQFAVETAGQDDSQGITRASCENSIIGHKCERIKDRCYCFVNTQLSWEKADTFCRNNNKRLLSIETAAEQEDVSTVLMPIVLNDAIAKKIGVWTSGSYIAQQKVFAWSSTQKPFTFINWFYNEPIVDSMDQCLRVRIVPESLTSGRWASLSCDQWLPFICQDDPGTIKP
ncbi:hypothetical protein GHT06_011122 [Daphnia sinensis]|uniref:C-type lectin domain-containing protein n=1 Tax=Daphnia sinensis TaxID=1820382 RepID=A0AAD5LTE1_9CRUS|nr:hypothetical protein GHT06_011122 [Daphnia sinensis]